MRTGIVGLPAPQLRDVRWIDGSGEKRGPLSLDDLGDGYRILYLFQEATSGRSDCTGLCPYSPDKPMIWRHAGKILL